MTLRDDLLGRARAVASVFLPVDRSEYDRAAEAVEQAIRTLERAARVSPDVAAERAALAEAEAALAAVRVREITVRAMRPPDWDDLIEAHPPTDEQRAEGWRWAGTFWPPALAASVVAPEGEEPLTEEDWEVLRTGGQLASGELARLYTAIVTLNERAPQVSTGKG